MRTQMQLPKSVIFENKTQKGGKMQDEARRTNNTQRNKLPKRYNEKGKIKPRNELTIYPKSTPKSIVEEMFTGK